MQSRTRILALVSYFAMGSQGVTAGSGPMMGLANTTLVIVATTVNRRRKLAWKCIVVEGTLLFSELI